MYPPHLPPPTCNVSQHRQWQRLKLIGVATFFGLLAGLTGAAVTIAFIWPNSDMSTAIVSRIPRLAGDTVLSERVKRQLGDTTFNVYKKTTVMNGVQYFVPADHLFTAAVGVSSGWLVGLFPNFDGSTTTSWRVVGPNNTMYQVVRVLPDPATGLIYFKIAPLRRDTFEEQFKVSQFANTLSGPAAVFVSHGGSWVPTIIRTLAAGPVVAAHPDLTTALRYVLGSSFPNGSVVTDEDGVVIGFVEDSTQVVPALSAVTMLTSIDSRSTVNYPSIGVEGWYSEEWPFAISAEMVTGFVVQKVSVKSDLKKGDIITEVNGRPMTFSTWWALRNDREFTVEVLRQRETITLTITR